MTSAGVVTLIPLRIDGDVHPRDDLAEKLALALRDQKVELQTRDILVIKHKVVSKAEGRIAALSSVKPSRPARALARKSHGDARLLQLALDEGRRVVRNKVVAGRGVLITETRHGFICANSGIDLSNVDGGANAVLLPKDPDKSAARVRSTIKKKFGVSVAVIISDSFGRAWREGLTEVAIGVAGMKPLVDHRGKHDPYGYVLHATAEAIADELACAAGLVCGKLNRTPFCIVRGFAFTRGNGSAKELIRPRKNDLFR